MSIKSITIFALSCFIIMISLAGCGGAQNQNKEDSQATNTSNIVKFDIEASRMIPDQLPLTFPLKTS